MDRCASRRRSGSRRFRRPRLSPRRDRRSLDDNLPAVTRVGGLCTLDATQRRSLRPAHRGREAHPIRYIGLWTLDGRLYGIVLTKADGVRP
jgi:hypothetical protein